MKNYYKELDDLRVKYPDLTYQSTGYDNIPKDVREANKDGQEAITKLLKESVSGFVSFQNFKEKRDGSFAIRCQTVWSTDPHFIGVSYFNLDDFKPDSPTWSHNQPKEN